MSIASHSDGPGGLRTYFLNTLPTYADDGGSDTESSFITVTNVPPTVTTDDVSGIKEGDTFNIPVGTFTDPALNVASENYTATIDWGDQTAPTVGTTTKPTAAAAGTVMGTHTYADQGDYTVTVTVEDDDGSRGLNGIMIDVRDLANTGAIGAGDLEFRTGNDNNPAVWAMLAATPTVTVRLGAGDHGSDRIVIIFPDNAVQNQWLQVTLKSTANTGVARDDVFYVANAVGESGDSASAAVVDGADEAAARANPHGILNLAAIDDAYPAYFIGLSDGPPRGGSERLAGVFDARLRDARIPPPTPSTGARRGPGCRCSDRGHLWTSQAFEESAERFLVRIAAGHVEPDPADGDHHAGGDLQQLQTDRLDL